jgi:hypothetical protein
MHIYWIVATRSVSTMPLPNAAACDWFASAFLTEMDARGRVKLNCKITTTEDGKTRNNHTRINAIEILALSL